MEGFISIAYNGGVISIAFLLWGIPYYGVLYFSFFLSFSYYGSVAYFSPGSPLILFYFGSINLPFA
jgi:hypothetical protein